MFGRLKRSPHFLFLRAWWQGGWAPGWGGEVSARGISQVWGRGRAGGQRGVSNLSGLRETEPQGLLSGCLDGVEFVAEVWHEPGAHCDVHSGGGEASADLGGACCVAGSVSVKLQSRVNCQHLLPLQLPQVLHGQLQHISLLKLWDALSLRLKCVNHQILQLIKAVVDPCSSLSLNQWLHNFSVLVSFGHSLFGKRNLYFDSRGHCVFVIAVFAW